MKASTLVRTYLGLLFLLFLAVASIHLSSLALAAGLAIAGLKSLLILLYFMKLRYRSGRMRILALASLLWVFFLWSITFADYLSRGWIQVPGK